MGTYTFEEHMELFGGPPEPGEYVHSLDAIDDERKRRREEGEDLDSTPDDERPPIESPSENERRHWRNAEPLDPGEDQ